MDKQYIGMQATPRYEAMILALQKMHPPMTRTEALKMLMDEGAKKILKGTDLPPKSEK